MTTTNRFAHGSGAYACRICTRNTRDTGDNGDVRLCPECYLLASEENSLSDSGEFYEGPAAILRSIEAIQKKRGSVRRWDELKAQAEKAIAAK